MKLEEYDFREYERKFVIVTKAKKIISYLKDHPFITEDDESISLNDLKDGFYGYIFMDNEKGLLLRVLGNDKTQAKYAKDVKVLIEYKDFIDCEFEYIIPEELDYSYEIINDTDDEYYSNTSLLNIRGNEDLDHLRDEENPDILQITINYDNGEVEYLDALSVENYYEEDEIIVVKLLEDSEISDRFKKGTYIGTVYKDEELIIRYLLELKSEEEQEEYQKEQMLEDVDKFNEDDEDFE